MKKGEAKRIFSWTLSSFVLRDCLLLWVLPERGASMVDGELPESLPVNYLAVFQRVIRLSRREFATLTEPDLAMPHQAVSNSISEESLSLFIFGLD
jgi:hypothetical protein